MSYVVPTAQALAALTAYRTAELNGCDVGIFINDFNPTSFSVIGDFVEPGAEWGGYARITITTWGAIYIDPQSRPVCDALVHVPGPTSGAGDNVYGFLAVDSGGDLIAAGRFDEGVQDGTIVGGAIVFVLSSFGILGGMEEVIVS